MKPQQLLLCLSLGISSFITTAQKSTTVGKNKDNHGCIGSAGYQWSILRNECVRSFEQKIQLKNRDKSYTCGIILSANQQKAELFCKEGHFILTYSSKAKAYLHQKINWQLANQNGKWMIKDAQGKMIYQD
ncbi:hypothetical protein V7S76_03035 [Aquirufa sp. ROCK2-A2]